MKDKMTKAQAQAWRKRWELVNRQEIEELQQTPAEVRLRQLATLMQWCRDMNWSEEMAAGEEEVRNRWIRLRKAYAA